MDPGRTDWTAPDLQDLQAARGARAAGQQTLVEELEEDLAPPNEPEVALLEVGELIVDVSFQGLRTRVIGCDRLPIPRGECPEE